MRPRFSCAACEGEIQWGERFCRNCGKPVEWPADAQGVELGEGPEGSAICKNCGSGNPAGAGFCGSCGAKLPTQAKSTSDLRKAGKPRQASGKEKEAQSSPLFSWKVIFGFLGVLLLILIGVEVFSPREQTGSQSTSSTMSSAPVANMGAMNQITELEKRVSANPNDMQMLLTLANACQDGRFFDKAIAHYKRYLEKNPKDANARVDLGVCYYESGNSDEAQNQMLTALKYDPKHVSAHFNLGIVNLSARRIQEANGWFKKTIALSPNSEMGQKAKQILEQHSSPLIQNK